MKINTFEIQGHTAMEILIRKQGGNIIRIMENPNNTKQLIIREEPGNTSVKPTSITMDKFHLIKIIKLMCE